MTEREDPIVAWYRDHGRAIYQRCLRLLQDPEAAADATQEVFLKLVETLRKRPDAELIFHWVYRVATYHCLNLLRRRKVTRAGLGEVVWQVQKPSSAEHFVHRELALKVLQLFDEETQFIALAIIADGMEQVEVAALLEISERTVRRRLRHFLDEARAYAAEAA